MAGTLGTPVRINWRMIFYMRRYIIVRLV